MNWVELLVPVLALVLTFLLGLMRNKPGYAKGKNVLATVNKALEDDALTAEEIKAIIDAVKTTPSA